MMTCGPWASDSLCVFAGSFWGNARDSWLLATCRVLMTVVCPAAEVPTVTWPLWGGWVTPGAGTEVAHPQVPQGGGSWVFCLLARPLFHPAAPSNKRGSVRPPVTELLGAACASVSLLLMKDLFRSPLPSVHSHAD